MSTILVLRACVDEEFSSILDQSDYLRRASVQDKRAAPEARIAGASANWRAFSAPFRRGVGWPKTERVAHRVRSHSGGVRRARLDA